MAVKRKREEQNDSQDSFPRPAAGTRTYTSGREVKDALSRGGRAAFIALHQQIVTPHSQLPLPITHQSVLIIQHYLALSPNLEEVFKSWSTAFDLKDQHLTAAVVQLLTAIINVLTPLPYFQTTLATIVSKILSPNESYASLMNRLVQSTKREQALLGVGLAAAAINVDSVLAVRVWAALVEGNSVKALPKLLGMRKRTTGTKVDKDPLDKPDIRHLTLSIILPLLSQPTFQAHAKAITPPLFSNLSTDPPLTVLRVLTALWNAITGSSASPSVNRRTAITLLDETSIEALVKLLSRTGENDLEGNVLVADMAAGFLKGTTCVPGRGICFQDAGWYPRRVEGEDEDVGGEGSKKGGLHNKILSNVVRKLGARVVDDRRVGAWVEDVLRACPELVTGYWPHSALSLDPRLHAKWIATISFIGRVVSLPIPPTSTFFLNAPQDPSSSSSAPTPRPNPPPLLSIVEAVLPAPLTKQHLTKGLQHPNGLVQHLTALALARGLQKLAEVQAMFKEIEGELEADGPWARRRREVELECRRRVPEVSVIIGFAQRSGTGQSNGPDADETQAAARTALLTESALRLFGLYHKALPSLAAEVRFDVGKLLVSASSAGALAAERRAAREGSVISDTGSVASVGTLGSVGMGGGFGHTRGDVEGFEALSQVHVLRLLQDVTEWNWANKAAGSPYSYLYHILQLHLSTPHPITKQTTTSLLTSLLEPSILYEHDPEELQVWLAALPMALPGDTNPVQLLTQRIHLLSFLDDSVRRCLKTPYRYIEEVFSLSPETVSTLNPQDASSPLLMTILEQLHAKLLGQHIATEAALAVVMYVRKLLLGLAGKQPSLAFVAAVLGRLHATVAATKEAGQARLGFAEAVSAIDADLEALQSGTIAASVASLSASYAQIMTTATDAAEAEGALAFIPFERIFISISSEQWADQDVVDRIMRVYFASGPAQIIASRMQIVLHRLASLPSSCGALVSLVASGFATLRAVSESRANSVKEIVFGHPAILKLLFSTADPECINALRNLIHIALDENTAQDKLIAEPFTRKCSDALASVKRKTLIEVATLSLPWIRFIPGPTVSSLFPHVLSVVEKASSEKITPEVLSMLAGLTRRLSGTDSSSISAHISTLIRLELFEPISELLRSQLPIGTYLPTEKCRISELERRWKDVSGSSFTVSADDVHRALEHGSAEAVTLLGLLASHPGTRPAVQSVCAKASTSSRVLPIMATILQYPVSAEAASAYLALAVASMGSAESKAEDRRLAATCLLLLSDQASSLPTFDESLSSISKPVFDESLVSAFASIATRHHGLLRTAASRHIDAGLQFSVRQLSKDGPVELSSLKMIKDLCTTIEHSPDAEVSGYFAEPVITAIGQERLESIECLEFATVLCKRSQLKAAFIRQMLQLVVASPQLAKLSSKSRSLDLPMLRAFTGLLLALFSASTYVSCQPNFIEPLIGLYRGTLDVSDRNILSIMQLFEQNRKISVASVMRLWSPDPASAASVTQRSLDVIKALDAQKVFATCTSFPLRRSFSNKEAAITNDDASYYDPVAVLSVTLAMLHEGSITGLDWVEILRSNVLGLAICALSSRVVEIRSVASFVLAKALIVIEATPFQERPQVAQTLRVLRHAIESPSEEGKCTRLPTLSTLFFAHALRSIANPSHFLYPVASRFLLQRAKFDVQDVPLLYGMLYAGGEGWKKERGWIVRLLRDGARSEADWRVLRRRHTFALLASLYQSSTDVNFRRAVLQSLSAMTMSSSACRNLVQREGFIAFLSQQWELSSGPAAEEERSSYLQLLENVVIALGTQEMASLASGKESKKGKSSWKDHALTLMRRALYEADLDRLSVLSRINTRMASLHVKAEKMQMAEAIFNRLRKVEAHLTVPVAEDNWHTTIINLFEGFMADDLPTASGSAVASAVACRMMVVNGPQSDWVRRQILAEPQK